MIGRSNSIKSTLLAFAICCLVKTFKRFECSSVLRYASNELLRWRGACHALCGEVFASLINPLEQETSQGSVWMKLCPSFGSSEVCPSLFRSEINRIISVYQTAGSFEIMHII